MFGNTISHITSQCHRSGGLKLFKISGYQHMKLKRAASDIQDPSVTAIGFKHPKILCRFRKYPHSSPRMNFVKSCLLPLIQYVYGGENFFVRVSAARARHVLPFSFTYTTQNRSKKRSRVKDDAVRKTVLSRPHQYSGPGLVLAKSGEFHGT